MNLSYSIDLGNGMARLIFIRDGKTEGLLMLSKKGADFAGDPNVALECFRDILSKASVGKLPATITIDPGKP